MSEAEDVELALQMLASGITFGPTTTRLVRSLLSHIEGREYQLKSHRALFKEVEYEPGGVCQACKQNPPHHGPGCVVGKIRAVLIANGLPMLLTTESELLMRIKDLGVELERLRTAYNLATREKRL